MLLASTIGFSNGSDTGTNKAVNTAAGIIAGNNCEKDDMRH